MRNFFDFWWKCARIAAQGCAEFANDWQWLFGIPTLAGLFVYVRGKPDVSFSGNIILDGVIAAAIVFAITFISRFCVRLVNAPVKLDEKAREEIASLKDRLTAKLMLDFRDDIPGCVQAAVEPQFNNRTVMVVRVRVTSEARVLGCIGRMLRVFKWQDGQWVRDTTLSESIVLHWANLGQNPIPIDPSAEQFLDVLYIRKPDNTVDFHPAPVLAREIFNAAGLFRIDIGVTGNAGAEQISLKFQLGTTWDEPIVSQLCGD